MTHVGRPKGYESELSARIFIDYLKEIFATKVIFSSDCISLESIEKSDLEREQQELLDTPEEELIELAKIYEKRGLQKATALEVAKQLTARSLPEIGRKFGGRDHTTVMHAVRKVEELKATDNGFGEDVELLRRMLEV